MVVTLNLLKASKRSSRPRRVCTQEEETAIVGFDVFDFRIVSVYHPYRIHQLRKDYDLSFQIWRSKPIIRVIIPTGRHWIAW